MAQNFLPCNRDQPMLLAPDMREWLPDDHLAWFLIDAVEELDLSAFYASYRDDGWGRAAHDPKMMLTLTLYSYAVGIRSSRKIERACVQDVAFRVICAASFPDHTTIARFRQRHEAAIEGLFASVLELCRRSGMGQMGTLAIDSTKIPADASPLKSRTYEQIAREVLKEADQVDREEDALYGEDRGDELPAELRDKSSRRKRLKEAKERMEAEQKEREKEEEEAKKKREALVARYEAAGQKVPGRPPVPKPKRKNKPKTPRINTTDLDSRLVKGPRGFLQGYVSQAVVSDDYLVVAAEITGTATDQGQLKPMARAAEREIRESTPSTKPDAPESSAPEPAPAPTTTFLADAAYLKADDITSLKKDGYEVLVAVRSQAAKKRRRQDRGEIPLSRKLRPGSVAEEMAKVLETEEGKRRYARRGALIEPVFGHIKHNRGFDRFSRRGLPAVRSEWRLAASVHNLMRLFQVKGKVTAAAPAPS